MNKDEALNKFTFMMEYRNLSSNTIHMYQWYLSQMFDFYHWKMYLFLMFQWRRTMSYI